MYIEVISHYDKNEDEYCTGDYCAVTVKIDDKTCQRYGDYYHDKGEQKAEGFIDGVRYFNPDVNVIYIKIADWDY